MCAIIWYIYMLGKSDFSLKNVGIKTFKFLSHIDKTSLVYRADSTSKTILLLVAGPGPTTGALVLLTPSFLLPFSSPGIPLCMSLRLPCQFFLPLFVGAKSHYRLCPLPSPSIPLDCWPSFFVKNFFSKTTTRHGEHFNASRFRVVLLCMYIIVLCIDAVVN